METTDKLELLAKKQKHASPSTNKYCITCEDAVLLMEEYYQRRTNSIRASVKWFAERMEQALAKNDHKGGWGKCDLQYLSVRLTQERKELAEAIDSKDPERIINECSDISNFSLMIADKFAHNYGH